jgi:hypothetical protein
MCTKQFFHTFYGDEKTFHDDNLMTSSLKLEACFIAVLLVLYEDSIKDYVPELENVTERSVCRKRRVVVYISYS